MFELLRLLAQQPGDEDIAGRLRASGATRIRVTIQPYVLELPVPLRGVPNVAHDAPPPTTGDVPAIVRESTAGNAFSPATAATRPARELIAELQEKPGGPHVAELLAVLGRQLETAMKNHRVAQALAIVVGVVRAEQQVTDATRRRQYSIALERMYSKSLLE